MAVKSEGMVLNCPRCSSPLKRIDGHGSGPMINRLWSCDDCNRAIPQTSMGVLHCGGPCFYDLCHECEKEKQLLLTPLPPGHVFSHGRIVAERDCPILDKLPQVPERALIKELRTLQDTIDSPSSAKEALDLLFGTSSGMGFLLSFQEDMRQSSRGRRFDGLHSHAEGLAAVLNLLARAAEVLSSEEIVVYFPKSCGGCFMLNLVCGIAAAQGSGVRVEQAATRLLRTMMGDSHGRIVEKGELIQLAGRARAAYTRNKRCHWQDPTSPFPYMGNCLDFEEPFREIMVTIGSLALAKNIRALMQTNEDLAVNLASQFLRSHGKDADAIASLGIHK